MSHPLVRQILNEIRQSEMTLSAIAHKSGVSESAIKGWRTQYQPSLGCLEAVANTLGYQLLLVPINGSGETPRLSPPVGPSRKRAEERPAPK